MIGAAFGALITALVENLLTPLIAAIFGEPDFSQLTFAINDSTFTYGVFINALIAFLSIAAAIFFFVVKPIQRAEVAETSRRGGGGKRVSTLRERDPESGHALRILHLRRLEVCARPLHSS